MYARGQLLELLFNARRPIRISMTKLSLCKQLILMRINVYVTLLHMSRLLDLLFGRIDPCNEIWKKSCGDIRELRDL